ncbi:MAG: 4Fe-4S binding protein [Candidatus Thiodiazotropha weberae]|nr:4Fe-4S binding protein [Candidatus Thiodiazotropha lotti]MCG7985773.1 4Fe-4S binding protein [Candidatus Thiodiazotropha lotti]MCG8021657.1 4Fe-4S binding protein [Candidatus Thiodiazotropha lotti]MCW4208826.1 4Fe-4S binding protein [Candidatus Thiodiazotropha lotti]MCW4214099.1 4Fe-4S binding protein [Candidatus Thiodiazotropha lotti]
MNETNNNTIQQINHQARREAQAAMGRVRIEATGLVNYQSRGRLAVIGDHRAMEVAPGLGDQLHPMVILTAGAEEPGAPLVPLGGRAIEIDGYLGDFKIHLGEAGQANYELLAVDLVLDLSTEPLLDRAMTPPGYFHCAGDDAELDQVIGAMGEMKGQFEKPRYFDYDPQICAHGRSGKTACSRCLDVCPAEAISSLAETIEVNAYLCQGGGACATVCPSGAIRYVYPSVKDTLERLRKLLSVYRDAGGVDPLLLITGEGDQSFAEPALGNHLVMQVEELASVGLEVWLSALAYGARAVWLVDRQQMSAGVSDALQQQLTTAEEILTAMGYPAGVIRLVQPDQVEAHSQMPELETAGFSGLGDKRQTAYLAIDHLYSQSKQAEPMASLSQGAPFGSVTVSSHACTLCFSCVGVCPGKALQSGSGEQPQLRFVEANCLQCGLCTSTCPEDAISIAPRLLFDAESRKQPRTLHEEQPFHCVSCGKPFATRSVIEKMRSRLSDHYMFQNERAIRRLSLCDECRVVDIAQDPDAMDGQIRQ